jgi:hypothetical protein
MGSEARRNDRVASISRDVKHYRAGEVLPPRFVHAASTTLTLGSLPAGGLTKRAVRWRPGTLEGAFTRWRIGGGASSDRGGKGRQGNRDIGEKRAPAGHQSNGAGSRRRLANVGQASRWGSEGQKKAGAPRGPDGSSLRRYRDDRENGLR